MSEFRVPVMDVSGNSISTYAEVFEVNFNSVVYNKVLAMEKKIDEMFNMIQAITSSPRRKVKKINQGK